MQRNPTSSLFKTQSGTEASKSPLTHRDYSLLLPPPPIRTLGETHNTIASGCRQSCRVEKGRKGRWTSRDPMICPAMHPTKDKANDEDSGESQHQCPGAEPALAASRIHHRIAVLQWVPHLGQLWACSPFGFLVAPQQRLCWSKFPPTTALGNRSRSQEFLLPHIFLFYSKPIVVKLRECLPPKKKTWPLLSDTLRFSLKLY